MHAFVVPPVTAHVATELVFWETFVPEWMIEDTAVAVLTSLPCYVPLTVCLVLFAFVQEVFFFVRRLAFPLIALRAASPLATLQPLKL